LGVGNWTETGAAVSPAAVSPAAVSPAAEAPPVAMPIRTAAMEAEAKEQSRLTRLEETLAAKISEEMELLSVLIQIQVTHSLCFS